jgi:hypothetical protein
MKRAGLRLGSELQARRSPNENQVANCHLSLFEPFGNSNERRCLHPEPSFFRAPLLQEWLCRPDLERIVWVHNATFSQPLNKELSAKERYLDLLGGNKRGTPASSLEGSTRQPHESKEKSHCRYWTKMAASVSWPALADGAAAQN